MNSKKILFVFSCLLIVNTVIAQDLKFFKDLKSKNVSSDSSIEWTQFGPGMSGNNKCAFWHPTDANVLFISPNMGNSYVSYDRGYTYQTVLNADAPGVKIGNRGPEKFSSLDFSRQTPDFGFSTDLKTTGIFVTNNKGKTWSKQISSQSAFGKSKMSCITVDPKNENIWYVGAGLMRYTGRILFTQSKPHGTFIDKNSQGKIWKSINKGETWKLINKGLHTKAEVETIIVDPTDSKTVYVSTNYGFYKSKNGGKSWKLKSNGLDTDVIRSFVMHHDSKTNKITLYIVAAITWKANGKTIEDNTGGIFKSIDNGESWTKINGDLALDMRQFEKNKSIKKSYYHVVAHYFGIKDKEAQSKYPELSSSITPRYTQITVDPSDVNNLYLINMYSNASRNNFIPGSMWRSKDGGKHWYITFRNGKNWNKGGDLQYWKKRNNPIGTNVEILYLHDWINRDRYERKACNYAKFNVEGTILHTQLAKISLMSYDKGDTWVDVDDVRTGSSFNSYIGAGNSNVPGHGFYQDKRFPGSVFCSAGENSLWVTNKDKSPLRPNRQAATNNKILKDEASLSCYAIHPKDSTIHYALFFRQAHRGDLMRSTNSGKTWVKHGTPIPKWNIKAHSGDQSVHQLNLIIDSEQPDNMYFCVPKSTRNMEYVGDTVTGFGVHKSTDGGFTWIESNKGLPKTLDVSTIKFDPKNNNVLYATVQNRNGGLYKSIDKAKHWVRVKSTDEISGEFGINDIHFAIDGKVYITSGYKNADKNQGGLWVSDNGFQTWNKLFDYPWVNRVEVARYDSKTILISTLPNKKIGYLNPGTYLSKDSGETWIKINKGNGQSDRINDIAIDYFTPGKYYVSTYGSGFYVAKDFRIYKEN
ncbi:hypothetical protein A8C32_05575 [Flavivirga aquatica]|uniref:Sortilin N-terminal domain-containing protein n=1 Tax=Flavivirga aquatica TaxID=1849968 RepID=A0A1E5SHS5_9FLAO|nr:hypothetical protein [Flavivirga aquatica]OEJ98669.1 hypothetical protein A8C32_05575 [Flavivirga aquatica]